MTIPAEGWFTSSFSNGSGNCVEVKFSKDAVAVRDTKDIGRGPILNFTRSEWKMFVAAVSGGEFAS